MPDMPASPPDPSRRRPVFTLVPPLVIDRACGEPISLGAALHAGKKVAPNILDFLTEEHRTVFAWFDWYESEAQAGRRAWVAATLARLLTAHMLIEEEIFYPAAARATGDRDLIDRALHEHAAARDLVARLGEAGSDTDALMRELRAGIEQHVMEEETELFPRVRRSGLDLYRLGREGAARRSDFLFQLAPLKTPQPKETSPMVIAQQDARELLVIGLQNVHGIARQGHTLLEAQERRVEKYPDIKVKLQAHLAEKTRQLQRVDDILSALGEQSSTLKDATGAVMGTASSLTAILADDEILKTSFALYGLANFEAAAYETLLVMAEAAGQAEVMRPLQQSLSEERAMAAFIVENLRSTSLRYLHLRSQGVATPGR